MSPSLISRTTNVDALKAGLDASTTRTRQIAGRIAQGTTFALPADGSTEAQPDSADLERDMASLADEQLRFEATARLLQKAYAGLRASIRDR